MDVFEKISKLIKPWITNPKKVVLILICVLMSQTICGLLYIRSIKKSPNLADEFQPSQNKQQTSFNKKLTFTQTEIAFILKGLSISPQQLYQYYQPQIDSIKGIITKIEKELSGLKNQLQLNTDSDRAMILNQQINFTEQQIMFYKMAASFWEDRSNGLKNLIKTLGLDSIMIYLTHQDSINQNLAKLAPPQIIIPDRSKKSTIAKTPSQPATNATIFDKAPSLPIPLSSETSAINEEETESPIALQAVIQNQAIAISDKDLRAMLEKHDFFDYYWNQKGKGFLNKFGLQILNGDTVVIDRASQLIWQQGGSVKAINYEATKKWIEELNQKHFAGFNDWRLPTLSEALTLVEPERNGLLYIDGIFSKEQKYIWTSDLVEGEYGAWMVNFSLGGCRNSYTLSLSNYFVRAVRSLEATSK